MKQKLEENKGIPASLLWILAIISGLSVANLYYNQPLLNRISEDLGISEFTANLIPMTTRLGMRWDCCLLFLWGICTSGRISLLLIFSCCRWRLAV